MNLKQKITLFFFTIQLFQISFSQSNFALVSNVQSNHNIETYVVSMRNNLNSREFISSHNIAIKSITKNWIYCTLNQVQLTEAENKRLIPRQKFDLSIPTPMNDTTRQTHYVNEVHSGQGLPTNYTGKNVIIGIIDT